MTAYWLAAVYGLKWFMNFTQLYGIPWRHAEVGDTKDENAVKSALASIGANGYIVTKPGVKINVL
ncbi:phage portal protein family protein, partial [Enterococcus faecium]|uniref:phage portal protein family protein n=1 Tax=Enterococcus faecium TaxID=1352 RepID=UPI003C6D5A5B